ncbi:MAG: VCBS repeat-containing protein, partial [Planctomycetaceae bacterium]|nr:VCBS repeat-containing protein [Planctomycetaceae bacterium]
QADDLAFPKLVDWNNDGLDDLAVFAPDDPVRFMSRNYHPDRPSGKFVVLRGSPPEAFRRLDRWVEEQDFDGDGIAELSQRYHGNGDYAIQIASGRDGRIMSKWKTEWPETPRSFTVGNVQSFPPPLGDFDGDGRADLVVSRDGYNWDFERMTLVKTGMAPLLMQTISSKTGKRIWGGVPLPLPDWLRPTDVDENSDQWKQLRNGRLQPISTQAVDLDGDGRPEVLQSLQLLGYRRSEQDSTLYNEHLQPFVALIDGRAGTLRWCEPIFDAVRGNNAPGLDYLRIDASTDLNGDGTRDLVLTVPRQDQQGSWSQSLQVHSGRDGKLLWGPKPLEGTSFNNNDFNAPIVSDLDGDGRCEIVLMPSKQPHVTVLRGDTGESLWTWQGSQPQFFAAPGFAVVAQSSPVAPRQESRTSTDADRANEAETTTNADSAPGNFSRGARGLQKYVAVVFNETGSQWNLVLLDHTGKELEKVPCQSNQFWSQDLDGDGGEELLRPVDNKIAATRGLHDVLWTWSLTSQSYGWVSHIERTAKGRVVVTMSGNDSVTLLDGQTGKPLGRAWRSCNASINENGRMLDLNRPKLNSVGEPSRLLTRVGDGTTLLGHVVSRAVLPTDDDGRYQRSRHAPRDEPNAPTPSNTGPTSIKNSTSTVRSAHHAERDGYVDDPRLVRSLPWVPSVAEWSSFWKMMLAQAARAILLSFIILLIPFWLIRAGVRHRELGWWRAGLIVAGLSIAALSITAIVVQSPNPAVYGMPWGPQLLMSV